MFNYILLFVLLAVSSERVKGASIGERNARHVFPSNPIFSQGSAMSYGAFVGQGPGASFASNSVMAGVGSPPNQPEPQEHNAENDAAPELIDEVEVPANREAIAEEIPASDVVIMEPVPVMVEAIPVLVDETEEEISSEEPVSEGFTEAVTEENTSEAVTEEISSEDPALEGSSEEPISEDVTTHATDCDENSSDGPTSDEPVSEEINSVQPVIAEDTSDAPVPDEPASDEPAPEEKVSEEPTVNEISPKESVQGSTAGAPVATPATPAAENTDAEKFAAPKKQVVHKPQSPVGREKPSPFPGFGGAIGWNIFPDKFFSGFTPYTGGGSGSSATAKASSSSSSRGNGAAFASSHATAFSGTRSDRR